MPSASERELRVLVNDNLPEPVPRAYTRRGRQLLKDIWRSLNDPETLQNVEQLRDQIIYQAEEKTKAGRAVGLAGPVGGEGTSALAILVGLMLSEFRHHRVLFVDGRLERKNFAVYHEMFGLTRSPLTYNNGCGFFQCYNTRNENLCFLTPRAGSRARSLEFFSAQEFARLVYELEESFTYVIFDMPPLLNSSETRMVLPGLDLFYLVCAARKTTITDVLKCKRIISEVGGSIAGVILNKMKIPWFAGLLAKEAFL